MQTRISANPARRQIPGFHGAWIPGFDRQLTRLRSQRMIISVMVSGESRAAGAEGVRPAEIPQEGKKRFSAD